MPQRELPFWMALMPRRAGLSWREIADLIADRTGRRYQPNSVQAAYTRAFGPDKIRVRPGRKPSR